MGIWMGTPSILIFKAGWNWGGIGCYIWSGDDSIGWIAFNCICWIICGLRLGGGLIFLLRLGGGGDLLYY